FAVDLSGYDGSITHYHVSYSDPQISGEVGVGHVDPTPTPAAPIIIQGVVCDRSFPGLLSGLLGLDLGLRINLALIGPKEPVDTERLKAVCAQIVREGDLTTLTDRVVRRKAETAMGLADEALDEQPYKRLVKVTVAAVLEDMPDGTDDGGSSDMEGSQGRVDQDAKDGDAAAGSDAGGSDSDGEAADQGSGEDEEEEGEEFSDVGDGEEPAPTRPKKRAAGEKAPGKPKRSKVVRAEGAASTESNTTVTNLKSYIGKCGLRKVWSRELAGMSAAQQIRHLKGLLAGLGMEGRPTLEKCKQIKAKRDLQAELEEMDTGNIIDTAGDAAPSEPSGRRRRAASKQVSYNVDHVSDSEEDGSDGGQDASDDGRGASDGASDEEESADSDAYTEDASDDNARGHKSADEAAPDSDSAE
ncbi:hypothetical protein LPJ61_005405, partial [Coemansia biformis]